MLKNKEIASRILQAYGSPKPIRLAEIFGIDRGTVSKWLNGTRAPTFEHLSKTVEDTKVSWDWLLGDNVSLAQASDYDTIAASPHPPGMDAGTKTAIEIPVYGSVAAATDGRDAFYGDEEYDTFAIPTGTGVLKVFGGSMEPLARNGQRVFLRPYGEAPREGDLVVVWTNEIPSRQLFKRWGGWVHKHRGNNSADDELILVSVNPIETVNLTERIRRDELGGYRIVAGVWYG